MRLSRCPCFTLRRPPAGVSDPATALLIRAGYWEPDASETPLGAALRRGLRRHLSRTLGVEPDLWARQPPDAGPLLPAHGPGNPRLAAALAWAQRHVRGAKHLPRTLAWVWPAAWAPRWGFYAWQWQPQPWPRPSFALPQVAEIPWGPGPHDVAWQVPSAENRAPWPPRWVPPTPNPALPYPPADPKPQLVATPAAATVEAVARQLGLEVQQVLKTLFWKARVPGPRGWQMQPVAALVPGERRLSPWRLALALGAWGVEPADAAEVRAWGAVPGFASPMGLDPNRVRVVLDSAALGRGPWVMGANRADAHVRPVWPGRDFPVHVLAPLSDPASAPGEALAWAGVVPQAWVLAAQVQIETPQGRRAPALSWLEVDAAAWMRALAWFHHDEHGLVWPPEVAPWDVYLARLTPRRPRGAVQAVEALAQAVLARLQRAGWRVLDDDREASPGVKLTDADLVGLPWRVVVSARGAARGLVEVRQRATGRVWSVPSEAVTRLLETEARG